MQKISLKTSNTGRDGEHKYYTFTIMNSFREDDYEEYYCDFCEEQRNLEHLVYCRKNAHKLLILNVHLTR